MKSSLLFLSLAATAIAHMRTDPPSREFDEDTAAQQPCGGASPTNDPLPQLNINDASITITPMHGDYEQRVRIGVTADTIDTVLDERQVGPGDEFEVELDEELLREVGTGERVIQVEMVMTRQTFWFCIDVELVDEVEEETTTGQATDDGDDDDDSNDVSRMLPTMFGFLATGLALVYL